MEAGSELQPGQQQQHKQQFSSIPLVKFKTAFEELCKKHELLNCGIEEIDSILKLRLGDRLAIIGHQKYTQTIITRLCINALLLASPSSKNNSRFFYTSNVILVDAGNSTDFYQHVNFARQYCRRDVINRVLNSTIITRPFTVYQLEDIVINQLPKAIQHYDGKTVIIDAVHKQYNIKVI